MKVSSRFGAFALVSILVAACSSTSEPAAAVEGDAQCDNLDESTCLFPFPSDHFRKAGGPYGHAFRLDFGDKLPVNQNTDARMSKEPFEEHDGFPIYPQIAFHMEGSLEGAPTLADIAKSTDKASKTLVVDADTLALAPHWAEYDYLAEDQGKKVVQLRLAKALEHRHRYVVVVRGLAGAEPSRGFTALRDGQKSNVAGIEERRAHFDERVFSVTDKLGIPRAEIQLAWDFTTTSEENSTDLLRKMRDDLYARIGEDGPEYTIDGKVDDPEGAEGPIATIVSGTAKVPSYMLPLPPDGLRRLRRDSAGMAVAEGFESVKFRVQIPRSMKSGAPGAVVQYGHGFLGSDKEADNGWLRTFANEKRFAILSADMQGMNTPSGVLWFLHLPKDITNLAYIGEEPLQGNMNHLALVRMMKGRFSRDPSMMRDGAAIYDKGAVYYHGNSQGGTQGALVMAMSKDLTRGTLGVPGVSVGWILARASQWKELAGAIQRNYPDPYDFAAIMSLVAVGWDRGDGSNFAKYLSATPPPDGTPKNVLLHVGLEDAQVNNDVSRVLARMVDAKILAPATKEVYGLPIVQGPVRDQNVYVDFDYGVPERTRTNRPAATETDTHGMPRKNAKAQEQTFRFFTTGEIVHTCEGTCNPE